MLHICIINFMELIILENGSADIAVSNLDVRNGNNARWFAAPSYNSGYEWLWRLYRIYTLMVVVHLLHTK